MSPLPESGEGQANRLGIRHKTIVPASVELSRNRGTMFSERVLRLSLSWHHASRILDRYLPIYSSFRSGKVALDIGTGLTTQQLRVFIGGSATSELLLHSSDGSEWKKVTEAPGAESRVLEFSFTGTECLWLKFPVPRPYARLKTIRNALNILGQH